MFSFAMLVVCPFLKSFCDLFAFFAYIVCSECASVACVPRGQWSWSEWLDISLWDHQEDQVRGHFSFPSVPSAPSLLSCSDSLFLLVCSLWVWLSLSLPLSLSLSQSLSDSDSVSVAVSASVSLSLFLSSHSLPFAVPFSLSLFHSLPHSFSLVQSVFSLSSSLLHSLSLLSPSLYLPPPLSHFIMSMQILATCVIISTAGQSFLRLINDFCVFTVCTRGTVEQSSSTFRMFQMTTFTSSFHQTFRRRGLAFSWHWL